jgi:hypothetical protein
MGKVIAFPPTHGSAESGPVPPVAKTPSTIEADGLRFKACLRACGCSYSWFGRFAGVTKQAVQRWCAGEVMVPEARLTAAMANPRCRRVVEAYRAGAADGKVAA